MGALFFTETADKIRIIEGFLPADAMLKMYARHGARKKRHKGPKAGKKRHGIRSAGNRDADRLSEADQPVFCYEVPHSFFHIKFYP